MTFLLVVFYLLLLLLLLLLFLPLSYGVRFALRENITYRVHGGSALAAFDAEGGESGTSARFRLLGIPFRIKPGKKEEKKEQKKPEKEKKGQRFGFPRFLLKKENLKHILRFCIELLAMLKPRVFRLDVKVGFVEPEYNGLALAAFYSLKTVFPDFGLNWETAWEQEHAEADGEIAGSVVPARVLWHVIVFLLSARTLRMLQELRRRKKAAAAAT